MADNTFDLAAFLPYRLAVLSERISRRLAVEYERLHGLSIAEWRVLVHLRQGRKVSVRDIHACVNLDKPRVSRAVKRLEASGLVKKSQDGNDARLVEISLTGKGTGALKDILPEATSLEARLLKALSPEELEGFCTVLEKLHSVLDADSKARPRSPLETVRPDP